MTQEIESIKPALSVILDDGDFIINSTGPVGKAMAQAVFPLLASARRVTVITDGEMKVMKRNGNGAPAKDVVKGIPDSAFKPVYSGPIQNMVPDGPDIQDDYVADLEAGVTGEQATGEAPGSRPTTAQPSPAPKRPPRQIFQDAAAPPAPELAEAEMDRLLQEAAQAERDVAKVAEDQRFQRQQAVQAGTEATDIPAEEPAVTAKPRKRESRVLAMTGRPCGKCGGSGQTGTQDTNGQVFMGACAVCQGQGQVQTFARGPKFR